MDLWSELVGFRRAVEDLTFQSLFVVASLFISWYLKCDPLVRALSISLSRSVIDQHVPRASATHPITFLLLFVLFYKTVRKVRKVKSKNMFKMVFERGYDMTFLTFLHKVRKVLEKYLDNFLMSLMLSQP
jgi:hypothetical protein